MVLELDEGEMHAVNLLQQAIASLNLGAWMPVIDALFALFRLLTKITSVNNS